MSDFLIITPDFGGRANATKLVTSCEYHGLELAFYGQAKWFRDYRQVKIDSILEYLPNVKHKYVMFTDAWDSWILKNNLFNVYKCNYWNRVVVSGNRDHYPATDLYDMTKFPEAPTSLRHICSSQFIGPREKIIELLTVMKETYKGTTDQEGWHLLYVNRMVDMVIDHQARLFLNMTNVNQEEVDESWVYQETKIKPCSIHFSGPKGGDPNAQKMEFFYEKWRRENIAHLE